MAIGRNVGNPYLNVRYRENSVWGGWNKISAGLADNLSGNPNINVGTINSGAITSTGEIRSMGSSFVGMGASWDHFRIFHDGAAAYFDVGGAENGIVFRIDNTASGYPAPSYPEKMRLSAAGLLTITGGMIANNKVNINNGASGGGYPYMSSGSLTIGGNTNYGGGSSWNGTNAAGLLMECADNTEIAIHDVGNRVASLMYYASNNFTLGRDMGWGASSITMASTTIHNGEIQIKGSSVINFGSDQTKADGGRIGYGTYEANSLCIVGGSTTGERVVSMWDRLKMNGRITTTGTIVASDSITGTQHVNNFSTLFSTKIGGAYGIFFPVTRWLSNGSTFQISNTIKIFTNGGNSVETTGQFWGNSTSGIVGATSNWSNGMEISSEPFYSDGTFYWRFFNTNLTLFGGYGIYKFIG
jgi:hypothetical protein